MYELGKIYVRMYKLEIILKLENKTDPLNNNRS